MTTNATTNNAYPSSHRSAFYSVQGSPCKILLSKTMVNSPVQISLNSSAVNCIEEEKKKIPSELMQKRLKKITLNLPVCDQVQIEKEFERASTAASRKPKVKISSGGGGSSSVPRASLIYQNRKVGSGSRQVKTATCSPNGSPKRVSCLINPR